MNQGLPFVLLVHHLSISKGDRHIYNQKSCCWYRWSQFPDPGIAIGIEKVLQVHFESEHIGQIL